MTLDAFHPFDAPSVLPRNRISVRDYVHEVEIGAFQVERGVTQRVAFNVVVDVAAVAQPIGDDVDLILSYDTITEAIRDALADERLNLLETLADRIASLILAHSQALRVYLQIQKLDRGPFALGVEVVRDKPTVEVKPDVGLAPLVVHLDAAAQSDARLPGWIDQLCAHPRPVALTLDPVFADRPVAQTQEAQLRIELLAIEQAAWALAAKDPRLVVVNTRTEIDWALSHGQVILWAPFKMVTDALDGPPSSDSQVLTTWFARTMEAETVLTLGPSRMPELRAITAAETLDLP